MLIYVRRIRLFVEQTVVKQVVQDLCLFREQVAHVSAFAKRRLEQGKDAREYRIFTVDASASFEDRPLLDDLHEFGDHLGRLHDDLEVLGHLSFRSQLRHEVEQLLRHDRILLDLDQLPEVLSPEESQKEDGWQLLSNLVRKLLR